MPITREIDAVVVEPSLEVIWVIEAKDLAVPFSARRIRSELDKYFAAGGHRDKLQHKCDEVASASSIVAEQLGASPGSAYRVEGLFVTREPTPASCHDDRRFDFSTIDRLAARLSRRAATAN